jgi:hypothetical protein
MDEMCGSCIKYELENVYQILVRKPEDMKSLLRPKCTGRIILKWI